LLQVCFATTKTSVYFNHASSPLKLTEHGRNFFIVDFFLTNLNYVVLLYETQWPQSRGGEPAARGPNDIACIRLCIKLEHNIASKWSSMVSRYLY